MFKLPDPPSPQAETHELADFVEVEALQKGQTSAREIVAILGREEENDLNEGCYDDEDQNAERLDGVMNEIQRRSAACGGGYPFQLECEGTVLRTVPDTDTRQVLYKYLLLTTRLDMVKQRTHDGIDGSLLLEQISAQVLRNYLGTRARSFVFGTAERGTFEAKIEELCSSLGEGRGFRSLDEAAIKAKDDKLDAVAWVPFADNLPGQLILFGQCKTGTSWHQQVTQLQPDVFIKKWLQEPFVVVPARVFCISEAADRSKWRSIGLEAGLLFDRCRIVDFGTNLDPALLTEIRNWTASASRLV